MAPSSSIALAFSNLSKTFEGTRALHGVDLSVAAGEVHGVVGHNGSGKSTLIKCLAGFHTPDEGSSLQLHGRSVRLPTTPSVLKENGVSFVHQNLGLFAAMSIAENLWVDDLATTERRLTSTRDLRERARAVLKDHHLQLDVDVSEPVSALSAVQRANLALVRAAITWRGERDDGGEGGVLVLDEPTAFLPPDDRTHLYDQIRRLAARGDAVVFVSHFLDEVLALCDRVSVLRDGVLVASGEPTEGMTVDELAVLVVGEEVAKSGQQVKRPPQTAAALTLDSFSAGRATDIDLTLRYGEVVGVAGLMGSGYDDLLRGLFGLLRATGSVELAGRLLVLEHHSPLQALRLRLSLVPVDREREGLAMNLDVADNIQLPVLPTYRSRLGGLRVGRIKDDTEVLIKANNIVGAAPDSPMHSLSGGNAQKALLVKSLHPRPEVLLLCDPTQGVDVGARAAIQQTLIQEAEGGLAILWASSDADELAAVCHRVAVMREGRIIALLQGKDLTAENISAACLGGTVAASSQPTGRGRREDK